MADHCYISNSVEDSGMDFDDNESLDFDTKIYLEKINELLVNIDNLGVLKSVLQAYNRVYSEDTPWGIEFTLRDEGCSFTISIRKNKDNHLVADAGEVESDKIGDALSNFGISPTAHKEMDYLNESVDGCGKFDIEINKTDSGTVEITMIEDQLDDNVSSKEVSEEKTKSLESVRSNDEVSQELNLLDSEGDSEVDLDETFDSSDDDRILRSLLTPKTYIKNYDDNNFRSDRKILECEYCFYKSPRKYRISEHIATKHPEVLLGESVNCSKKTKTVISRPKKSMGKSPKKKPSTQKKTLELTRLKNQVKSKNDWLQGFLNSIGDKKDAKPVKKPNSTRIYKCSFCPFVCNDQTELYRHIGLSHAGDSNLNLDCMLCHFKGDDRKSYLAHLRTEHPGKQTYTCKECDYKTDSVRHYNKHVKEIHRNSGSFTCQECDYTASTVGSLYKHVLFKHKKTYPFVCSEEGCDYRTLAESNFQAHIMEVHRGIRPLSCPQPDCNFATSRHFVLKRHQYKEHGIGSPPPSQVKKRFRGEFQCPHCPKTCSQKVNLQNHIRIHHLGLKDHYQCGECDFSAAIKNIVDIHIREMHKGYYPFKCEQCDYKTSVKQRFDNHYSAVHLKERPYKCPHCDHRASQRTHIRRHIRDIHLREKPNLCAYCKFCTANRGNLKAHLKKVHKVTDEHIKEVLQSCVNLRKNGNKEMTLHKIIVNSDTIRDEETLRASQILVHISEEVDGTVIIGNDETVYT